MPVLQKIRLRRNAKRRDGQWKRDLPIPLVHHIFRFWIYEFDGLAPLWVVCFRLRGLQGSKHVNHVPQ